MLVISLWMVVVSRHVVHLSRCWFSQLASYLSAWLFRNHRCPYRHPCNHFLPPSQHGFFLPFLIIISATGTTTFSTGDCSAGVGDGKGDSVGDGAGDGDGDGDGDFDGDGDGDGVGGAEASGGIASEFVA